MQRLRVRVSGRVQGVGYRWAAAEEARRLGLAGWVRNLPGGGVEALFEGPAVALAEMRDWCALGPRLARVDRVEESWEDGAPSGEKGFQIRG
ncbi:MAG TPA: acylphosphatase [Candidatus Hydrogenedentes bacterium]|nr:acylphosphatase [Candidatus Hydrogenedentota bacterium]HOC71465.1 acylphosphatase [Candidatus Hydrogenedentota bacterium]HOH49286.1 acylphosphatase [Candidatus Hydrogenedentota bacterium]HPA42344.1 acylphosphatase [Candidatus Hydrogenedentota bacterium]HQL94316.1 acylphosphatase [Candidatus Hydrogenedentota bacterium]